MNREEFFRYIEDFNRGDPTALGEHFTDDLIFENYGDRHEGSEALKFLASLMELLHIRLLPEFVLVEGDRIGFFGDIEAVARIDHTNPAMGPMAKGDRQRARTFVFYETVGTKICHVWIAGWPGAAVSSD